jgi:hypothetical protein
MQKIRSVLAVTERSVYDFLKINRFYCGTQVIRKKYADLYISRTDIKSVLIYGICFCKKECTVLVKKLK